MRAAMVPSPGSVAETTASGLRRSFEAASDNDELTSPDLMAPCTVRVESNRPSSRAAVVAGAEVAGECLSEGEEGEHDEQDGECVGGHGQGGDDTERHGRSQQQSPDLDAVEQRRTQPYGARGGDDHRQRQGVDEEVDDGAEHGGGQLRQAEPAPRGCDKVDDGESGGDRDGDLSEVEGRLDGGPPADHLCQQRRQQEGRERTEWRRHERQHDEEALVEVMRLRGAFGVHHDRPDPAGHDENGQHAPDFR